MRRFGLFTLFALAGTAVAQIQGPLMLKDEQTEILPIGQVNLVNPSWSGGGILGVEKNRTYQPIIWTIDRSGTKEEVTFSTPGRESLDLLALGRSSDGTIALGGYMMGSDWHGFLGIIPPDRGKPIIVQTWPYAPRALVIAPDGVIWTVGWYVDLDKNERAYNILKRFDKSGTVLSSIAMKVKGGPAGGPDASDRSTLRASADRVGWLTTGPEYIEFTPGGKEVSRFEQPPWGSPRELWKTMAFHDNDVLAATWQAEGGSMWTLDRMKRKWIPLHLAPEAVRGQMVLGMDGEELVTSVWSSGLCRIARYAIPQAIASQ